MAPLKGRAVAWGNGTSDSGAARRAAKDLLGTSAFPLSNSCMLSSQD